MWKAIKNVVSAASNIVAIGAIEVSHQINKASTSTESVTSLLAEKSATIRAKYEEDLADRKAGIKRPEVVTESETPKDIVPVN